MKKSILNFTMGMIFTLILSALTLGSCGKKQLESTENVESASVNSLNSATIILSDSQIRVAGIVTSAMKQEQVSGSMRVQGEVVAAPSGFEMVVLPVGGVIQDIRVKPGDVVKKGQVLFVVSGASIIEWQQQYIESLQELQLAQSLQNREKLLFEKGAISERQWQETQSQCKVKSARCESFKAKLALLGIPVSSLESGSIASSVILRSPASGTIEKVMVNQGDFSSSDKAILSISKSSQQQWVLKALPQDAELIKVGNKAVCEFVNGEKCETRVTSVASELGNNNLVNVYVAVSNKVGWVPRFGSSFTSEVYRDRSLHWVLPDEAVIESDGKKYCFVTLKPGQFGLRELQIIGKSNGLWVVGNPIKENIVKQGAYWIWMQLNKSEE